MINDKKVLAIIPARGGSKGLPGKNIKELVGKPLICHTIDVSLKSLYIDMVVVSTDDEIIARVAKEGGANVVMRPLSISSDESLVIDAMKYTVNELKSNNNEIFDFVLLLEPTSPLRTAAIIDESILCMYAEKCSSIATYSETEIPPTRTWDIKNGHASPFITGSDPWLPRQKHIKGYQLNGLLYGIKECYLMEEGNKSVITKDCFSVITPRRLSVDIDTIDDFELVEFYIKKGMEND